MSPHQNIFLILLSLLCKFDVVAIESSLSKWTSVNLLLLGLDQKHVFPTNKKQPFQNTILKGLWFNLEHLTVGLKK